MIYVTQVADVKAVYETIFGSGTWDVLSPIIRNMIIRTSEQFLDGFNSGTYDWTDALKEAIQSEVEFPDDFDTDEFQDNLINHL